MSSYYKKIDGKNYDRAMLDIAQSSIKGKGDGRISLADSRNLIKAIKDGGKITDIEKRTLNYILEKFQFTETALKHIEKSLSDNIISDFNKDANYKKDLKEDLEMIDASQMIKPSVPERKRSGIFLILVLLLLAVFAVFAFIKYFYKNTKIENIVNEKQEQITAPAADETAAAKKETVETTPAVNTTESVPVKPLADNEYLVKEKDTLVKISEEKYGDYRKWADIYKLNKGKISNPTILYPGQVLIMPEKDAKN